MAAGAVAVIAGGLATGAVVGCALWAKAKPVARGRTAPATRRVLNLLSIELIPIWLRLAFAETG